MKSLLAYVYVAGVVVVFISNKQKSELVKKQNYSKRESRGGYSICLLLTNNSFDFNNLQYKD